MSFLTDYENDIYISYKSSDNQRSIGRAPWVDTFHQDLETRLKMHLGAGLKVSRRLPDDKSLLDTPLASLPKVAIFIAIMSPRYADSEWCRREMQLFSQIARQTGGVQFGNKSRIFEIQVAPVPPEQRPLALQGATAFQFYSLDKSTQASVVLSTENNATKHDYRLALERIAEDLANLLKDMKQGGPVLQRPPGLPPSPPPQKYDVFISYRRQDGSSEARLIRAELRQNNLRAFLDVDDLGSGLFDQALLKRIANIPSFIVVLSPNCLERCANEGDWLRQEIAQALKTNRKVIPVMVPGFQFPDPQSLPADLRALSSHQGVYYSHEYFEAMIAKVVRYLQQE